MRTTKRSTSLRCLGGRPCFRRSVLRQRQQRLERHRSAPATTAPAAETTAPPSGDVGSRHHRRWNRAPPQVASGGAAMTLTMNINPDAMWDDGSPITVADFKCTLDATLNTPGSITTVGYDKITSVEQGTDDHQVVAKFSEVYAPYKNLFATLIKAAAVEGLQRRLGRLRRQHPVLGACRTRSTRGASIRSCS